MYHTSPPQHTYTHTPEKYRLNHTLTLKQKQLYNETFIQGVITKAFLKNIFQMMAEEQDGEATFSPINSSKEQLNAEQISQKQLLIASRGHQTPRKATHCLQREGKNFFFFFFSFSCLFFSYFLLKSSNTPLLFLIFHFHFNITLQKKKREREALFLN